MTDETKKLFDAPWKVRVCEKGNPEFESVLVVKKTGWLVGRDMEYKTAKRVARLPELYDALEEATHVICLRCLASNGTRPPNLAHFKKHCGFDDDCKYCTTKNYWKLLQKVRDGE